MSWHALLCLLCCCFVVAPELVSSWPCSRPSSSPQRLNLWPAVYTAGRTPPVVRYEPPCRRTRQTRNEWLMASVEEDDATVVSRVFDEAARRDSGQQRTWVALRVRRPRPSVPAGRRRARSARARRGAQPPQLRV